MMAVPRDNREGRKVMTRAVSRGSGWQVDGLDF